MTQLYTTDVARIGKLKGEILKRAMAQEVLGITGQHKPIPKNNSDTVEYKRYLPYGGVDNVWVASGGDAAFVAAHLTAEGVTPSADTITSVTVTSVLQEYAALYSYTNKTGEMHEDDIPSEMIDQTSERLTLVREMVRYGELKSCGNAFFGGAGTDRSTVDGPISVTMLRLIERALLGKHGKLITEILAPSPNFATAPVQAAFLVFTHTDVIADIEGLPGYTHVSEYGQRKPVHEMERGSWGAFRFIVSPELVPIPDAGAAVGATGLYSTTGSNIDIYPMIITAKNAWGSTALRGVESLSANHIPPGTKDKSDPLGQRGYIGARIWFDTTILNDDWMAVAEVGVSAAPTT